MNNKPRELIFKDDDITVYEESETLNKRIGGYIYVINNHTREHRYKEWKWYKQKDGTVFNDREYVIYMLSSFVRRLHIDGKEK